MYIPMAPYMSVEFCGVYGKIGFLLLPLSPSTFSA